MQNILLSIFSFLQGKEWLGMSEIRVLIDFSYFLLATLKYIQGEISQYYFQLTISLCALRFYLFSNDNIFRF